MPKNKAAKPLILRLFAISLFVFTHAFLFAQTKSIILGRPTDTSITASILFDQNVNYYLEYGTQSGTFLKTTAVFANKANTPDEIVLQNLSPNTKYFYRIQYHLLPISFYTPTPEYSFNTQRAKGSSFTFTIEADEFHFGAYIAFGSLQFDGFKRAAGAEFDSSAGMCFHVAQKGG